MALTLVVVLLVLVGLFACLSACALARLLQLTWGSRSLQATPDPTGMGLVSAVIAARDEGKTLLACLQSVLEQDGVSQVVLVDDHSSDNTLDLAQDLARSNPRLLVLSAPPLPEGWIGKSHALHYAAPYVTSRYVLFTDADVLMKPGTVASALRLMEDERLDHLSGYFRLLCAGVAEAICAPVLAVSAGIVHLAEARASACGIGAFNMLRTDFYRQMGGHEGIKSAIVDDVLLAQHAKAHGAITRFVDLSACVEVRLFEGLEGFISKVRRATVPYLEAQRMLPLVSGIAMIVLGSAMTLTPIVAGMMICASARVGPPAALLGTWGLGYGLGLGCVIRVRNYHSGSFGWGFLYPFAVVLFGWAVASGAVSCLLRRELVWRGRGYALPGNGA